MPERPFSPNYDVGLRRTIAAVLHANTSAFAILVALPQGGSEVTPSRLRCGLLCGGAAICTDPLATESRIRIHRAIAASAGKFDMRFDIF